MAKRKGSTSSGVEALLDDIHDARMAEATARGMTWCGRRSHPNRVPGRVCAPCIHQLSALWAFWRSMGVRQFRDMP